MGKGYETDEVVRALIMIKQVGTNCQNGMHKTIELNDLRLEMRCQLEMSLLASVLSVTLRSDETNLACNDSTCTCTSAGQERGAK